MLSPDLAKLMSEMVGHYVEEEEQALFPELRKSNCDLRALAQKMARRKAELEGKLETVESGSVGDKTGSF
jgi:hypothetical protein